MNLINEILLAVLMLTATVVLIYLVVIIKRVFRIIEGMEGDLKEVKSFSIPVLNNIKALTDKTDDILFRIEQRVIELDAAADEVKSGLTAVKDGLVKIKNDFPVKAISDYFSAFYYKVSEFFKRTF